MLQCTRFRSAVPQGNERPKRTYTTSRVRRTWRPGRVEAKGEGEESTESLFAKELKRRGLPQEPLDPARRLFSRREEATYDDAASLMTDEQWRKSRALNSEGLEGLVPRAKELLILGGSFTASFLPSIIVISAAAAALYIIFGESLVHFGRADMVAPTYVNPYELLGYPYTD